MNKRKFVDLGLLAADETWMPTGLQLIRVATDPLPGQYSFDEEARYWHLHPDAEGKFIGSYLDLETEDGSTALKMRNIGEYKFSRVIPRPNQGIASAQPGDIWEDPSGQQWNCVGKWQEPTVMMETPELRGCIAENPVRKFGGISGIIWHGWKLIMRADEAGYLRREVTKPLADSADVREHMLQTHIAEAYLKLVYPTHHKTISDDIDHPVFKTALEWASWFIYSARMVLGSPETLHLLEGHIREMNQRAARNGTGPRPV